MENKSLKGWLYLLPALLFLGIFMVYPLIDVFIYSVEEGYNSASQTFYGYGAYNFSYVLHDTYFLQAIRNTFLLVVITVPISTGIALLLAIALVFALLYLIRVKDRGKRDAALAELCVSMLPIVWFSVAAQPTCIHAWFQYRGICVSFCGLMLVLRRALRGIGIRA